MRKLIIVFIAFCILPTIALADIPDISHLTFDELVELKEQINLAIWNCQEWQEVLVPEGIYQIGKDIPEGHWSIRTAAQSHTIFNVSYFDKVDAVGKGVDRNAYLFIQELASPGFSAFGEVNAEVADIDMKAGWYFKCGGAVYFTPYTGIDLGFQ